MDSEGSKATSNMITVKVIEKIGTGTLYIIARSRLDVKTDGYVNNSDLEAVQEHMGEPVSDVNRKYDINEDRYIDIYDVSIIGNYLNIYVYGNIYVDGVKVWTNVLSGTETYVLDITEGTHLLKLEIPMKNKVEYVEETVTIIKDTANKWVLINPDGTVKLYNPWGVQNPGARLLSLTGNVVVDALRLSALIMVILCIFLLVLVYKNRL